MLKKKTALVLFSRGTSPFTCFPLELYEAYILMTRKLHTHT